MTEELANQIKHSFFSLFERERTPNSIHVSALPFCLRKEFFNIRFNANPEPNSSMIAGKIYHLAIRHLNIFSCRDSFEVELTDDLKNGYRMTGRADVITEKGVVYEFKFTKRLDSSELDPLYFAQANAYAVMAGCDRFVVVKVHRENYDVRVLEGGVDPRAYEALRQRAMQIVDCLESDEIPSGPELEWECKNCVYNVICRKIDEK